MCVGLLVALAMVTVKFVQELVHTVPGRLALKDSDLAMLVLSLADLALLGNLLLAWMDRLSASTHSAGGPS